MCAHFSVGNWKTLKRLFTLSDFWQFKLLWGKWGRKLLLLILTCKLRGWGFEKLIIKGHKLWIIPTMSGTASTTNERCCWWRKLRRWVLKWRRWGFLYWHWARVSCWLETRVNNVVISRLIIIHEGKHGSLPCFEFVEVFIKILLFLLKIKLYIAFF